MFSAIIFACSLQIRECQTITSRKIFTDEQSCMTSLSIGTVDVQMQGWQIMQSVCYRWASEA